MDNNRITYLYYRHLSKTLNQEELQEFKEIILDPDRYPRINHLIDEDWDRLRQDLLPEVPEHTRERVFEYVVAQPQRPRRRQSSLWPRIAAAASVLLCCSIGFYFYQHQTKVATSNQLLAHDIAPGKNTATLTLANGHRIVLSEAVKGELAKEAGVSITKTADGKIVYNIRESNTEPDKINTLSTAKGETYQVVLPDGSHVWLNAASSLKYPARFPAGERKVELSGEAYFEVAHNARQPFRVATSGQMVEDVGTHFNISSYTDEPATLTTLLDGAVKVNNNTLLKPGQQARLTTSGNVIVMTVDTEEAIAWKNGVFMFSNEPLGSIMRKIGRWYNTDVTFNDEQLKQITFSGTISRMDKVSKVLRRLELTNEVTFTIEKNRIVAGTTTHP